MKFTETRLSGAYVIELERIEDARGYFARTFCRDEFQEHGLDPDVAQCNLSYSAERGTLRGMHFQRAPHEEAKLVHCTRGRIFDVIVDLRPESETYTDWNGRELDARDHRMVYVPEGFAHGFLTLEDDVEVLYQMSTSYAPDAATGVRWDDPAFGIQWPGEVRVMSEKDRSWPDFDP